MWIYLPIYWFAAYGEWLLIPTWTSYVLWIMACKFTLVETSWNTLMWMGITLFVVSLSWLLLVWLGNKMDIG